MSEPGLPMLTPRFIDTPGGRRFAVHHPAVITGVVATETSGGHGGDTSPDAPRGLIVYLHPWGEEMNKSRRMAARQARAAAQAGFHVLQLDLRGCGDSEGELAETAWDDWIEDVVQAVRWLRAAHPADAHRPLWLWGLRAGALLALDAVRRRGSDMGRCHFMLWQTPAQGRILVQAWLRLGLAAEWAQVDAAGSNPTQGAKSGTTADLRRRLDEGHTVSLAGQSVTNRLIGPMESAHALPPPGPAGTLCWLELRSGGGELPPVSLAALSAWQAAGWRVHAQVCEGPAFWQTVEIEDAPALRAATTEWLNTGWKTAEPPAPLPTPVPTPVHGPRPDGNQADGSKAPPEVALRIPCQGEHLVGVLSLAPEGSPMAADSTPVTGVVLVVGGPQVRVGSHRMFVQLARHLASQGHPTLRLDVRGMGDSTGEPRSFEDLQDDLDAAIDGLQRACPQVARVVLMGLCDGASAVLLWAHDRAHGAGAEGIRDEPMGGDPAHRHRPVAGVVLLNPWVRHAATQAQVVLRHYYLDRLRQPAFWRKLLGGGVSPSAWQEAWRLWRGQPKRPAETDFSTRMARGLAMLEGPALVLLSGRDYTAREFEARVASDASWQAAVNRRGVVRCALPQADHTCSGAGDMQALQQAVGHWLADAFEPRRVEVFARVGELPHGAQALLRQAEQRSVQLGPDWMRTLEDTVYQGDKGLHHFTLSRGPTTLAVWSVRDDTANGRAGVSSLANFYCALTGPVLHPACTPEDLSELIDAMARRLPASHRLTLYPLDLQGSDAARWRTALTRAGYATFDYFGFGNWVQADPGGWSEFFSRRSANLRSNVRRAQRRLERAGASIEIIRSPDAVARGMDAYEAVYARSWKKPEPHPAFFRVLAQRMAERDALRLGVVWLKGQPIAATLWTVVQGVAEIHKLAYDEAHKPLGAGTALSAAMFEQALEQDKVRLVDYLIGDDDYKRQWMGERRERGGLLAGRWRDPRGLALILEEGLRRGVKRLFTRRAPRRPVDASEGTVVETGTASTTAGLAAAVVAWGLLATVPQAQAQAQTHPPPPSPHSAPVEAAHCAPIAIQGHYGPYDYLSERSKLLIVDQVHFTPAVEQLRRGATGALAQDLSYTLNAAPNHHRALHAVMRLAERERTDQPAKLHLPVSCYFDRAVRFRPRDTVVRGLYAQYLAQFLQRREDALQQVQALVLFAGDNPLSHYNAGLLFLELGEPAKAVEQARRARALGDPRTDLADRLRAAGHEPEGMPAERPAR